MPPAYCWRWGHQRFHQQPRLRVRLGNAGQRLQYGKGGHRRIANHSLCHLSRGMEALAIFHQILREAQRHPLFRRIGPPGQHHISHAGDADEARQAGRAAAADENAALAFGQGIKRTRLRHADMGGAGQFQPAADHRALQHGNHRHAGKLDSVKGPMPHAGMGELPASCARSVPTGRDRRRNVRQRRA